MAKLKYFLIAVGSLSVKRQAIFTYSSSEDCTKGQIVSVKLRSKEVLGVVVGGTAKPLFKASVITQILPYVIPSGHLNTLLWATEYYPFDKGAVVRLFTPPAPLPKKQIGGATVGSTSKNSSFPKVSHDQFQAIKALGKMRSGVLILHGATGTGKTLIYIDQILKTIAKGKSVLLLVPEISLGEQIKAMVEEYVDNVLVYNSLLTDATRRDLWYSLAKSKEAHLVIGPRSALFLPLVNLGAIYIDEAHDSSFKQQSAPYYTTLNMAAKLASELKIPLVYGSATPNVSDYKVAIDKKHTVIELYERPIATSTKLGSDFEIIDIKERGNFTKNNILSDKVIKSISQGISNGKQSLLLLNRRGTAHLVQCESCGWQYRCQICDHTLVYHKDSHSAHCHYCDRKYLMLSSCPVDDGPLKLITVGTKHVEEDCKKLFPEAPIIRLDTDSVTRENVLDSMEQIKSGKALVIIGTQLVAKGLDLPFLKTIVVIDAKRQSSDYLGDERYYQLLHQVIGRGQRGHQQTKIYIQTPQPKDPLVNWAIRESWPEFYVQELEDRQKFNYPPFCFLAVYKIKRKGPESVVSAVEKLRASIKFKKLNVELLGPMPSSQGVYDEWQVIAKSNKRSNLILVGDLLGGGWTVDLDAINT